MKRSVRTFLTLLLAGVFLFSTGLYLIRQREKAAGSAIYAEALALATSSGPAAVPPLTPSEPETREGAPEPEDPHMRMLAQLDLEALRQVNPDVVGWILIPDTPVNYPLMQSSDNHYYLNRTWDREAYGVGSIFLEHQCLPDLSEFHTIIYGHNMNDGSMFGSLMDYREEEYLRSHPYVYIRGDFGVYRYEIFSSYFAGTDTNTYGIGFTTERNRIRFLDHIAGKALFDTGIRPETSDRVLTLSTCSGRGKYTRLVVHSRLDLTWNPQA